MERDFAPPMEGGYTTVDEEIQTVYLGRPHFVLLGAGATRAALPNGDRRGRTIPLMNEIAIELNLVDDFPDDLKDLAKTQFEFAYSQLFERAGEQLSVLNSKINEYFKSFLIPSAPTAYDFLLLSLRKGDCVFSFNWDPILVQSLLRLQALGVTELPRLNFLHGNVAIGYCLEDHVTGLVDGPQVRAKQCSHCGLPFEPTQLLYPIGRKDYTKDQFIQQQWVEAKEILGSAYFFTVFGYSAPETDVEAVSILKDAWGTPDKRFMEQIEIIDAPGVPEETLHDRWESFINTHHYEIHDSFFESWLANHPRRGFEAYWNQYWLGELTENNPVPIEAHSLLELVAWYEPLIEVERAANI
jgi:hypothetical protein